MAARSWVVTSSGISSSTVAGRLAGKLGGGGGEGDAEGGGGVDEADGGGGDGDADGGGIGIHSQYVLESHSSFVKYQHRRFQYGVCFLPLHCEFGT